MKERPILFSAPMVRAILEGRKTQTRRTLKVQPSEHVWSTLPGYQLRVTETCRMTNGRLGIRFAHSIPQNREWDWDDWTCCPYGAVGDRLWVRETWSADWGSVPALHRPIRRVTSSGPIPQDGAPPAFASATNPLNLYYRADNDTRPFPWVKWRPSIHIPRWASRITLKVTGVRVERLHDISERDALLEGCGGVMGSARSQFEELWSSINGAESWAANPWVWCIQFKRVTP